MSIYFKVTENWDLPRFDTVYPSYQTSAYIRLLGITNLVISAFFLLSSVIPLKINATLTAARISITADAWSDHYLRLSSDFTRSIFSSSLAHRLGLRLRQTMRRCLTRSLLMTFAAQNLLIRVFLDRRAWIRIAAEDLLTLAAIAS